MIQDSLKVYLFNVGAGDHLMLEFPDGSIGVIDSFYTFSNLKLQEPPALTYLKYRVALEKKKAVPGKVVIAFLCISHADIDHVKEIDLLFKFIIKESDIVVLENLWLFGGHDDNIVLFQQEIATLEEKILKNTSGDQREEISISTSKYIDCLTQINDFKDFWRDQQKRSESYFTDFFKIQKYGGQSFFSAYSLGPISSITNKLNNSAVKSLVEQLFEKVQAFTNPLNEDIDIAFKSRLNKNSISAILGIHFYEYNLIFGGDATKETLEASLDDIPQRKDKKDDDLFNPDFIKISHHGSRKSSSPEIWQKFYTSPKGDILMGISAGLMHGHPHNEFFKDVSNCCMTRNIKHNIYRTNQCIHCKIAQKITGKIDLDVWFQYHGCVIDDKRLEEAFMNDSPENKYPVCTDNGKNLLAFIFEFPAGGINRDIKVYKGLSGIIGKYTDCTFSNIPCTH